jgi:outer membrane protein assembly factor BamB
MIKWIVVLGVVLTCGMVSVDTLGASLRFIRNVYLFGDGTMKRRKSAVAGIFLLIFCLCLTSSLHAEDLLYGSDTDTQELYSINTSNASIELVGSFGVEGYMGGLAYDSDNDIMYGTTTVTDKLYSIDYTTGSASFIGDLDAPLMHGLAYDNSSDILFGTSYRRDTNTSGVDFLYQIDVSTGHATLIGDIGQFFYYAYDTVHGLAIHPLTNELYGVIAGPTPSSRLVNINKTTGEGTLLHTYTIDNLTGLTFLPDGTLYATNNWSGNLYTLDITNGSTQLIGGTGLGNGLGLAATPEPATLLLLGLGGMVLRRRKA